MLPAALLCVRPRHDGGVRSRRGDELPCPLKLPPRPCCSRRVSGREDDSLTHRADGPPTRGLMRPAGPKPG